MLGAMFLLVMLATDRPGLAARSPFPTSADAREEEPIVLGDAARGREIYHKIGGCSYCHGIDGRITKRPPMPKKLAQDISQLTQPPANLRDPVSLKSENDEDRFVTIKFGHPGTTMVSKRFLRHAEIMDVLAYLAELRGKAASDTRRRP
jgi:mono/diheme cytochrome c family protein